MYAEFFGLKQEPFSIAPGPRYLFMSERHREALAHLLLSSPSEPADLEANARQSVELFRQSA